jgi:hypothetical protein
MQFLIVLIKVLTILAVNIGFGLFVAELLRFFLINQWKRKLVIGSFPLTPGFIIRKRQWVLDKAYELLSDYLDQAEGNKDGYLAKWELKVYNFIYENMAFIEKLSLLPESYRIKIRHFSGNIAKGIAGKLLCSFVPHLIEKYKIENKIDLLATKIEVEVIIDYYNRYVHEYLTKFNLIFFSIIGLVNVITFLLLLLF